MTVPALLRPGVRSTSRSAEEIRAQAHADATRFRALAQSALRDGAPKGEFRAANARAAARSVLAHARRLTMAPRSFGSRSQG